MIIHTIGPVWDGNEVWLLTAGGATFAAFPGWYASLFSGFYLALFLILAALIVRGVSFEFWGKDDSPALARHVGVDGRDRQLPRRAAVGRRLGEHRPRRADERRSTTSPPRCWDLLHPYALLGGLTTLVAVPRATARSSCRCAPAARWSRAPARSPRAASLATRRADGAASCVWTSVRPGRRRRQDLRPDRSPSGAVALAAAVPLLLRRERDGWAFALSAGAIALLFASLFVGLYPARAALEHQRTPYDLTLAAASSSHYTQTVMTVVAVIFVPIVLAYQGWTYWVFRHRLGRDDFEGTPTPIAVLASSATIRARQPRAAARQADRRPPSSRRPRLSDGRPARPPAARARAAPRATHLLLAAVLGVAQRRADRRPGGAARLCDRPRRACTTRRLSLAEPAADRARGGAARAGASSTAALSSPAASARHARDVRAARPPGAPAAARVPRAGVPPASARASWPPPPSRASTRSSRTSPATCRSSCSPRVVPLAVLGWAVTRRPDHRGRSSR